MVVQFFMDLYYIFIFPRKTIQYKSTP